MIEPGNPNISENHRRVIGGTLRALDELLSNFERWMRDPPAAGPLHRESDSLTERQKRKVRAEIAALRALIAESRDRLGLEARNQELSACIWSRSAAFWEALMELESRRLKGYGEAPEFLAEYFDPVVKRMLEHLRNITAETGSPANPIPVSRAAKPVDKTISAGVNAGEKTRGDAR